MSSENGKPHRIGRRVLLKGLGWMTAAGLAYYVGSRIPRTAEIVNEEQRKALIREKIKELGIKKDRDEVGRWRSAYHKSDEVFTINSSTMHVAEMRLGSVLELMSSSANNKLSSAYGYLEYLVKNHRLYIATHLSSDEDPSVIRNTFQLSKDSSGQTKLLFVVSVDYNYLLNQSSAATLALRLAAAAKILEQQLNLAAPFYKSDDETDTFGQLSKKLKDTETYFKLQSTALANMSEAAVQHYGLTGVIATDTDPYIFDLASKYCELGYSPNPNWLAHVMRIDNLQTQSTLPPDNYKNLTDPNSVFGYVLAKGDRGIRPAKLSSPRS